MNVAVFDAKPYDRQYLQAAAAASGIEWRFHEFRLTSETVDTVRGVRAVSVFVNDRLDAGCLEAMAKSGVVHIALRCAGFNNVDLRAARTVGIRVTRVPAYSPHAVAEHTVALLLTLNRHIHRAFNRVREHNFSLNGLTGFDLHGKTVGIVGTGRIGRITAEIFRGFGCKILLCDPLPDETWATAIGGCYTTFPHLLESSNVVSLHLPLTPDSHHLLNRSTMALMKHGAYLINTSRGKLVDTTALLEGLKSGRLGGVALDVYEEEEGVFFEEHSLQRAADDELNLLLTYPNVLVTSHQAFLTVEALQEIARVTVANLLAARDGHPFLPETALC